GPFDTRVREIDVGKYLQCLSLDPAGFIPALLRIIEETFQTTAGTDSVCHAIAVQVYQSNFWIFEIEAGLSAVALKGSAIPQAAELKRKIPSEAIACDHEVRPAITVGVNHLHARIGEAHSGRRIPHFARQIKLPTAGIAPVTHRAVHLQDVGQ